MLKSAQLKIKKDLIWLFILSPFLIRSSNDEKD